MVHKVYLSKDSFIVGHITNIDCPNSYGGVGDVSMRDVEIWTGVAHLYAATLRFNFSSVKHVYVRSSLDEGNEKWREVGKVSPRGAGGYYKWENMRARKIRRGLAKHDYE